MAQILEGGRAGLHALLYGDSHPGTDQYFESQRGSAFSHLTQTAQRFVAEAADRFGFMAKESTQRIIHNVRRQASWAWHGDYIRPLLTVSDLQVAAPTMQRIVMAQPTIRRMYHRQQLAGYDGLYVDNQPGVVGDEHYDYQRVMNGIIVDTVDEDGEPAIEWTEYLDHVQDGDRKLTFIEQLDSLNTWGAALAAVKARLKDPTSRFNASCE